MTTARISARRTDRATHAAGVRAAGRALALCPILIPLLALSACGGTSAQHPNPRWTAWTGCGLISFGPCPADAHIDSVAMASPTEGWAVGAHGIILHYADRRWTRAADSGYSLAGVALASADEGWAVGILGTILHFKDGQWSREADPAPGSGLNGVAVVSTAEAWAVGDRGTILHYADGRWASALSPAHSDLRGLAMVSPSDYWAVGFDGTILHYAGETWSLAASPNHDPLFGLTMISPSEGWAVGNSLYGGTILHYTAG